VIVPIRRVRRAPWVQEGRQWLFYSRLQVDLEAGVGPDGLGKEPLLTLSWSDNRGKTWTEPVPASEGKLGVYRRRAIWRRLARSRQRVFEVASMASVKQVWLKAFIDVTPGTF